MDTETTGKADFKALPIEKHQPRVISLACLMCTDAGQEYGSFSCLLKPEGFDISPEATKIHGITTEFATQYGMRRGIAIELWSNLVFSHNLIVAHNIDFDWFMFLIEAQRHLPNLHWQPVTKFCTMKENTEVCKLPTPYGGGKYKWPKLEEAYRHYFGCNFLGAHDALADVRACKEIYFRMQEAKL